MKVIFLGYMGSGKSTIGKQLSKMISSDYLDLDDYISDKENSSVKEVFKSKGEIYFRKKETEYLKLLLESKKDFVLSLGGGTPCYGNNMDLIAKNATSFYLKASINELYDRLKTRKSERPLIKNIANDDLKEFIAKHLFERSSFYEKANHSLLVDGKSIDEIVNEVMIKIP